MYRQGDILLRKVDSLPKKAKKKDSNVILEGEATGHAHRIQNGLIFEIGWPTEMYIKAQKGATITHDEHETIDIEPGIYQVVRQREYDPSLRDGRWIED
jgi:hypothetical protein